MKTYKHSVSLDVSKCHGCTTCLRYCPTEAIRIRDGHAVISSEKCIDCGECIRVCPNKAKKAVYDKFDCLSQYKYKIALPAPALFGQFDNMDDLDYVLQGLLDVGFDDVYEVSRAAELVSAYTRRYMKRKDVQRPIISSACPVITRLISLRFPDLCEKVMPILPPIEIAAKEAKAKAMQEHPELKPEEIGAFFISPCPAKVSYVTNGADGEGSYVDKVLSISDLYFLLIDVMKHEIPPVPVSRSGMIGISWASAGGEATAIFNDKYLAVDGVENCIKVLDQIESGTFPDLEFIELNACHGGCVGGTMTVANPYIAKARLQTLRRYLPVSQNFVYGDADDLGIPESYLSRTELEYQPAKPLSSNFAESRRMMSEIQQLHASLPCIDCGSCGSPTCLAFAEDVVRGEASIEECIIRQKPDFAHKNRGEESDS